MGPIEEQLLEVFGDKQKVGASDNTRELLETAEALRLVKRTGAFVAAPPLGANSVTIMGKTLPILGRLFDQYERTF